MKKPVLLIGLFLTVATIALVYAMQSKSMQVTSIPVITHPAVNGKSTNGSVAFEWKLANPYMLLQKDPGDAYLELRVTGKSSGDSKRKPLNLVLVIDRSGSMGDENKLEQVKEASSAIIDQMSSSDRLGIVIYDDVVQTLLPSTRVENPAAFRELLATLSPGGSTNLCGGLQQGFEEARKHFQKDFVNRVILLSDGLANVGVIDPEQISTVAKGIRERSISVSTMGVGLEFNETLMANIADHSGGNYYYVSKDVNMAQIFRNEWNLMQNLVATNAIASLELNQGVEVKDVAGYQWEVGNRKLQVQVPDIYSGESKRILIHLKAPADVKTMVSLGKGEFTYTDLSSQQPVQVAQSFAPAIQVIEDRKIVDSNYEKEIQAKVASFEASKKMEEAYQELEAGNQAVAYEMANDAAKELDALGYTQNAPQAARYQKFAESLSAPAAIAPEAKKDMLKRQKAADRKTNQSTPQ